MSLAKSTIATIGSGVMAEAMIAGLLRGKQVAPHRIIATHPRADRRSELISTYGISTVEDNASAVEKADVVVLAIKPQSQSSDWTRFPARASRRHTSACPASGRARRTSSSAAAAQASPVCRPMQSAV